LSQSDLLKLVVRVLDGCGIDYMLTGSFASSLHGEPRSTHDIDLVLEIAPENVAPLVRSFQESQFYLSEEAAQEAIQTGGTFNLLDTHEGDKVDFWVLTDDAFDQSRFSRKYVEKVFGVALKVPTPEDTILQKLRWCRASGGSRKPYQDALRVYEVQQGALDLEYVDEWADRIDVRDLWEKVQEEAEPIA
jgi:hypothetical protein